MSKRKAADDCCCWGHFQKMPSHFTLYTTVVIFAVQNVNVHALITECSTPCSGIDSEILQVIRIHYQWPPNKYLTHLQEESFQVTVTLKCTWEESHTFWLALILNDLLTVTIQSFWTHSSTLKTQNSLILGAVWSGFTLFPSLDTLPGCKTLLF